MLESLSPIDVALIKKIGGNGSSYTLPIANETTLGGVKPVAKTAEMTQPVGVDGDGGLWAPPGSGGSGETIIGEETVLASGTIASGTAKNSKTTTGITLSELRKWKQFTFEIRSQGQTTYWSVGFLDSSGIIHNLCRVQNSNIKFQVEWADSAKSIVRVFYGMGTGYEYNTADINERVTMSNQPPMYKQAQYGKITASDDEELNITHFDDLTVDSLWRLKGVLKYGT